MLVERVEGVEVELVEEDDLVDRVVLELLTVPELLVSDVEEGAV